MDITLTDSLFLTGVISILMINYVTRRVATAQASRQLVKDHIKGTRHHKQDKTMLVLRDRLSLQTGMLIFSAFGALLAFASTAFVVLEWSSLSKILFVAAVASGLISLVQSIRESFIANKSHFGELDATVSKDDPYYGAGAP